MVKTAVATMGNPGDGLQRWAKSFERHLRAEAKSKRTVGTYGEAVGQLIAHVALAGVSHPRDIKRAHIEEYMDRLLDNDRPGRFGTANCRFRALQQFFKWLYKAERCLIENPMADMIPPKVPEKPLPLLPKESLQTILATCKDGSFESLRDEALMRLMLDSGPRRAEVIGIRCDEMDIDNLQAIMHIKGGHTAIVPFGPKTARALDRYERARARHPYAHFDAFWLSRRGAFGASGLYLMLRKRAAQVGFRLHPHQLRHIWAHESRKNGVSEGDLQRLGHWRTRRMLDRYGASLADERARDAHRKHGFGDQL